MPVGAQIGYLVFHWGADCGGWGTFWALSVPRRRENACRGTNEVPGVPRSADCGGWGTFRALGVPRRWENACRGTNWVPGVPRWGRAKSCREEKVICFCVKMSYICI